MQAPKTKLRLRRETLRNLDTDVQRRVEGGGLIVTTPTVPVATPVPSVGPVVVSAISLASAVVTLYSMFQSYHTNCCVSQNCPSQRCSGCKHVWSGCVL